jgi:hypothetical protein
MLVSHENIPPEGRCENFSEKKKSLGVQAAVNSKGVEIISSAENNHGTPKKRAGG